MLSLWRHRRRCLDRARESEIADVALRLTAMHQPPASEWKQGFDRVARRHRDASLRLRRWWSVPYDSPDLRSLEDL
ncbi:MAG: hypothetical protein AAGA90_20535 [Actinomycetota bacterium]